MSSESAHICKECGYHMYAPEGGCAKCDGNMIEIGTLFEPVSLEKPLSKGKIECDFCAARKECDVVNESNQPHYNPYFRLCHDHGYLKAKEAE